MPVIPQHRQRPQGHDRPDKTEIQFRVHKSTSEQNAEIDYRKCTRHHWTVNHTTKQVMPFWTLPEKFKKKYDDFVKKFGYCLRYDYDGISKAKENLLLLLYSSSETYKNGKADEKLAKFIKENDWIKTYAVYKNLKHNYEQASWKSWHKEDQKKDDRGSREHPLHPFVEAKPLNNVVRAITG
jgi:4-alpha-glucanotransferase